MRARRSLLLIVTLGIAMAVFVALACAGEDEAGDAGDSEAAEVTAKEFEFIPDKLRVEEGQTFEVRFENSGDAQHTFTIDEFDVDAELAPGEEQVVLVATPARAGQFAFYCRFHRSQGMEGALTIGEGAADGSPGSATPVETTEFGY